MTLAQSNIFCKSLTANEPCGAISAKVRIKISKTDLVAKC